MGSLDSFWLTNLHRKRLRKSTIKTCFASHMKCWICLIQNSTIADWLRSSSRYEMVNARLFLSSNGICCPTHQWTIIHFRLKFSKMNFKRLNRRIVLKQFQAVTMSLIKIPLAYAQQDFETQQLQFYLEASQFFQSLNWKPNQT